MPARSLPNSLRASLWNNRKRQGTSFLVVRHTRGSGQHLLDLVLAWPGRAEVIRRHGAASEQMVDGLIRHGLVGVVQGRVPIAKTLAEQRLMVDRSCQGYPKSALV